jgi:hypothetical protein
MNPIPMTDWVFLFGMVGLAIGAIGFADALQSRLEVLRLRRKAFAAADNINMAIEAVMLDPYGLDREDARTFLVGVAADLEMIAKPAPSIARRIAQG